MKMMLSLCIVLGLIVQQRVSSGLEMTVTPRLAYLGEFEATIRCDVGPSGANITKFGWLQILKKADVGNMKSFLTLYNNTEPIWGNRVNQTDLVSRTSVTWSADEDAGDYFLQMTFNKIDCEDSGQYWCLFSASIDDTWTEEKIHDKMIVYSYFGVPHITHKNERSPDKSISVYPGEEVTLKCAGPVGRPHTPIFWYKYNLMSGAFMLHEDRVSMTTNIIPDDDLCNYHGEKTLTVVASLIEPEMTFKCQFGYLEDFFTITVYDSRRAYP